jgi:hypothetical protein
VTPVAVRRISTSRYSETILSNWEAPVTRELEFGTILQNLGPKSQEFPPAATVSTLAIVGLVLASTSWIVDIYLSISGCGWQHLRAMGPI